MSQAVTIRIGTKENRKYTTLTSEKPEAVIPSPTKLPFSTEKWTKECRKIQKTFVRCVISLAVSIAVTGVVDFVTFGTITTLIMHSFDAVHLLVMESHHLLEFMGFHIDVAAFKDIASRTFSL